MKKTLLILTSLFISTIGISQVFSDSYFTFSVLAPGAVSLSDYDMAGGTDVIIPATVTYDGDEYDVTYIGYQAFMSNELTSVEIPNTVTDIVNGAFLFNSLSTVTIPSSVLNIRAAAFGSNELTEVVMGENVIAIDDNAFNGNLLTSFTYPVGVTTIGKQVFANNNFTDLIIPNGITEIGEGAFQGNPLTSVTSINSTPPVIVTGPGISDSFAEDRSEIYLYIPVGTEAPYVTDPGALWTGFKEVNEITFAGVEGIEETIELNLYPNPVTSQFTIESEEQIQRLVIINPEGRIVENILNPSKTIDVSTLPKGVYFLQIQTENGLVNKKFIKE